MRHRASSHFGYIFLIGVLAMGAIVSAATLSLILLGLAAELNSNALREATQAYEYAQTCTERSLLSLRADTTYAGNETINFTYGSCTIRTIGGYGNSHRALCVEGVSSDTTRRIQVKMDALFPTPRVSTWQEVSAFTLCP